MSADVVNVPRLGMRKKLRWAAALLSVVGAVAYLTVFLTLLLADTRLPDDPTPLFAVLAGVYLVGAILVLARDSRVIQWVGVGIQIVMLGLYVGITVVGETQFALRFLVQGMVISAIQLVLAGLLAFLAVTRAGASVRAVPSARP